MRGVPRIRAGFLSVDTGEDSDDVYGRWAASDEIDIMKHFGHEPDTDSAHVDQETEWAKDRND
jgi:hypothetical protein